MAARVFAAGALLATLAQASPMNGTVSDGIVYTTEVVTALTTYCPAATTLTHGDKTYTVTEATTLTITDCPCTVSKPVGPTTTASVPKDECASKCYEAYNMCRGKPSANMATCAAEYASCLGYVPFGDDGSLVTPTACSSKTSVAVPTTTGHVVYTTEVVTAITTYCPAATTMTFGNKTYTVTEPTTLTVTDCPCTVSKPHPSATSPAAPDCPAECQNAYNACRSGPGANMATCAAKYAACLGYSPFGPDGSLVTPTACSQAPTGQTSAPAPSGTAPVSPPGVTSPGVPTTPIPTAAAGRVVPGALIALGAIALL